MCAQDIHDKAMERQEGLTGKFSEDFPALVREITMPVNLDYIAEDLLKEQKNRK